MSKGPVRRIGLRAVVAYPAASVALVVSIGLAITPFGPAQVTALAATTTATETSSATTTATSDPTVAPTTAAPTTAASTTTTSAPTDTLTPSPTAIPSPSSGAVVAPDGVPVDHHVLARIAGPDFQADYLPIDEIVPDAAQFQTFRVRFKLHNDGTDPMTATPRLEYRADGSTGYLVVPVKPLKGIPFHVTREWVPSLGLAGGTMQGPLGEAIVVGDLRTGSEGGGVAVIGHHSMGANPDQALTLPAGSYTEEEFTVTLSIDAQYLTTYQLRITDGGTPLTGADVATIRLGAAPVVQLSPGQRQGVAVVDPKAANTPAGATYPLLSAQTTVANTASVSAVPAVYSPSAQSYPLTANALPAVAGQPDPIHGPYTMTTDACGVCHRVHTAKAPNLLAKSRSDLCFECHGTGSPGANTDVQTQYTDAAVPVNVPSAREYYSHDAVDATPPVKHSRSELDEFGGVSNRHSECADCHNSHKAKTLDSTQTADGWDTSGSLAGVSGVSVLNGATPGSAPTYTFLDGVTNPVTREYQLCFKCHSGSTTLTDNTGLKPSQYALDKGVEFNPANASFHPVEAAGKNDTTAMTASLAATSPYKLWNFTIGSTIRCLNCHATGTTPELPASTPPSALTLPQPGSDLAPHTSANRGILLRNYQDRVLKATGVAYSAGDFALCFVCHGEEPFVSSDSTATNFNLHAKHVSGLEGGSGDTSIDIAGAGQGNAICAECHFRIHSTTNKVGQPGGSRLVNFAPNVEPSGVTLAWTPGTNAGGSCTLTCHGYTHEGANY